MKKTTIANFATVQTEGSRDIERNIDYYNLDVVISACYHVKSLGDDVRTVKKKRKCGKNEKNK